jgi:hypothetical protein
MNAPRFLAFAATALACASAHAGFADRFKDPEDGEFDASEYLLDHRGVLPLPILITEPAVGYGGGVAFMWFSESLRDVAERASASGGRITPPNIYGAMVAGTENGTKMGGAAARMSFDEGRWLYRGAAAAMDLNLDFYGIGGTLGRSGLDKIAYNLKGAVLIQEANRRLGNSDHFLGARFLYMDIKTRLDASNEDANLTARELAKRTSQLGVRWLYDSRDNIFATKHGTDAAFDAMFSSPSIGSDNTFQTYRAHVFHYLQPTERTVLAFRVDGRTARGDVPFYQLPFIDMRGIPAARYQDENTGVLEAEARYYVTPRWIVLGFAGAGRAWGRREAFDDTNTQVMKGVGFRYLLARRLGLAAGIDVAWGPEKAAWYLSFGNSWK